MDNDVDNILNFLFKNVPQDEMYEINNLHDANKLIIRNTCTGARKLIDYYQNFKQFLNTIKETCLNHDNKSYEHEKDSMQTDVGFQRHNWVLESNEFCVYVKPFVHKDYYNVVKDKIYFDNFFTTDVPDYINTCVPSGDYYYWPNWPKKQAFSFVGWRLYLNMKFGIVIDSTIPIVNNKKLGPIDLFVWEPDCFLNVEINLSTDEVPSKTLFVNGKSKLDCFNENLFVIKMANGTTATCKVCDNLTNCNKNFFDYIRDDITLEECITVDKYKHIVNVNLKSLRFFENYDETNNDLVCNKNFFVESKISASSNNADFIYNEIASALFKINEGIVKVIVNSDDANDDNVLQKYLEKSNFKNFDYVLFVIWNYLKKHEKFEYNKTDTILFFELLCELIFNSNEDSLKIALNKCEPYIKLKKDVFDSICKSWFTFTDINPCTALGYYFGIHYAIYLNLSASNETLEHEELWAYNYDNVLNCNLSSDVLSKGFFRKLENVVTGVNLIFNGKHYQIVKKEDELFKMFKSNCYRLTNLKFNNWKYLYLTAYGVYNVTTNTFHSSCPFLLGTTLPHPFKKPFDEEYLSKEIFTYMLKTSEEELDIYRIYHIAKMCRDVKMLKTNLAIVNYMGNCKSCQNKTRVKLNDLFRDLWNLNDEDFVVLALYLKRKKVMDILHNFKCSLCCSNVNDIVKCECVKDIKVNRQILKICLMADLFGNDADLSELLWLLVFNNKTYLSIILIQTQSEFVNKYAKVFYEHRNKIIKHLYQFIHEIEFVDILMCKFANKETLVQETLNVVTNQSSNNSPIVTVDDKNDNICNFFLHHSNTSTILKKYNVWWDKIVLARENDDLSTWLIRFYMRIIMFKMDVQSYSYVYLKKIVKGYLFFKRFTNFNHANSIMLMHYAASLAIPTDYGKKALYLPGEPGSGKSSFFELLEYLVLMHKFDDDNYGNEFQKETSDKEVTKLNSQLYTINELKTCSETYFKKHADSSKSDSKSRKYQGLLKYEANYKMLIVNNNPLYIDDFDDGVKDRFLIIYTNHKFLNTLKFKGSIYYHIKNRQYPLETSYYESSITPVRLFLSHVLMYGRDFKTGLVNYQTLFHNDTIHEYNLLCLSVNNSPLYALIYILDIKTQKSSTITIEEDKMEEMIGIAVPYLKTFLHPLFCQYNSKKTLTQEIQNRLYLTNKFYYNK
ncbi:helicase [Oxyplax ochracea nucleopolyhedrovirus]|uniref:Helicase n=1 Tax=Oxyplax ochracea nucleopolyhedrovirus TaxID=2083176 RepID=A0A2L0WU16_9ABAC|nr:helicase [Oxyplax ochracea nucleopolyhedrovirus]AVA31147.1 helicase [Oxyplax ochracea nucleopolyhedrovirus]